VGLPLLDSSIPRVTPPQASPFAELVAGMDRAAMERLGGVPVLYQPEVGAPVPVTGIFDEQFVLVKGDIEAGTEALGPAVFLRLEDLPVDPKLDKPTLIIGGQLYKGRERHRDGFGGIVFELREVR
jgi:hypothetical protein